MAKQKIGNRSKPTAAQKTRKNDSSRKAPTSRPPTNTKQGGVIGLLSRAQGATIPAIMKSTGWQQHSVRGFLAGVVRKKLGLALESEKKDGADRIYRIVPSKPGSKNSDDREAA